LSPATPHAARAAARTNVVVGADQDPGGFNPALACCTGAWTRAVVAPVIRGAYLLDGRLDHRLDLAVRAHATATTLSYTIRRDAYWNWGGKRLPVTYRDFVYTWQMMVDPNNGVAVRDGYDLITGYSHRGERQVTFIWKQPYGDWVDLFDRVYPVDALAGTDFNHAWASCICGSDGQPVGDGPYLLTGYTQGQGSALTANPYWYGHKPRLKEVDFRVLADGTTDAQAISGAAVDVVSPPFSHDLLRLVGLPHLALSRVPGLTEEHVDLELGPQGNLLLRAPWVRRVLMLAIDRGAIIRAVFGDLGLTMKPLDNALFAQADPRYRADFAQWRYAPGRALRLLKRHCVGGPTSFSTGNTLTWSCSGYPASFRFTWTAGNVTRATQEELIKTQLKAVGIDVTDAPMPANEIFTTGGIPAANYDLADFAWSRPADPGALAPVWSCGGAANYLGYCDTPATRLLESAGLEVDPARRAADLAHADRLLARDLPSIPLYAQPAMLVRQVALQGPEASPVPGGFTWNVEDWHWRR
jgi:peptide/nickel transport system substrate-binding protein